MLAEMRTLVLVFALGCGTAQADRPSPVDEAAPPAPTQGSAAPATPAASAAPAVESVTLLAWKQEVKTPVVSLALGKKRAAALAHKGDRIEGGWLFEAGRWAEIPFPDNVRAKEGERDDLRVFFGRDDRPRVMGTRSSGGSSRGIYLRHRGAWAHERGEIGKLADAAVLFGILGHDDPEVVCKLGDTCVIKRLTGWTYVPPPPKPLLVELANGVAWGVGDRSLYRLGPKGFERIGGDAPFAQAASVWASGPESVWVSEPASDSLHRFESGRWTRHASPVKRPRGLWGRAADDVWLAGEGGAAHFDGKSWRRVAGVEGPLREVRARENEVWVAGESGVWRGSPK